MINRKTLLHKHTIIMRATVTCKLTLRLDYHLNFQIIGLVRQRREREREYFIVLAQVFKGRLFGGGRHIIIREIFYVYLI